MAIQENQDAAGDWNQRYTTSFLGSSSAWDVKFEIEKTTGILLTRDPEQTSSLVFRGDSQPPPTGHNLELRLIAVLPDSVWYSLDDDMWLPRSWSTEAKFRSDADRTFDYWTRNLRKGDPGSLDSASQELYEQMTRETLEREAQTANRKEDEAAIRAIQQAILAALRNGKRFGTAHHEGGTRLYFSGAAFVKEEFGMEESLTNFAGDEDMLTCLRNFYDWESRKATYPHKPPELDVWKFIQRELM